MVAFKIRSRTPKSNQIFPPSQQCIYASLVKIYPLVQKIMHRNPILHISKCLYHLENKLKVNKILSILSALSTMCHLLVQKITHGREATQMRMGSAPNNIYPPPFGWGDIIYQLPLILTALLHIDLLNVVYFTALLSSSRQCDVELFF